MVLLCFLDASLENEVGLEPPSTLRALPLLPPLLIADVDSAVF